MKTFLKDMAERAIKTGAQVAVATIGTSATLGEINAVSIISTTAVAMIVSILTSIASYNVGDKGTASLVSKGDK